MGFSLNSLRTSSLASVVKYFSAISATVWWPLQPQAFAVGTPSEAINTTVRSVAKKPANLMAKWAILKYRRISPVAVVSGRRVLDAAHGQIRIAGPQSGLWINTATKRQTLSVQCQFQALNHRPIGRQDSVWSQITRKVAVIGIASNNPIPPHTQPQNRRATVIATAFSRTRRPISAGAMKFAATMWIVVSTPAIKKNEPIDLNLASAITKAGNQAITAPI